jgi:hypothetical protein
MYFVWFVVHVLLPSSHLHVILFLLTMGSDIISHRVAIWLFYIKANPSAVNYIFCKTFNSLDILYLLVRYCRYFVLESYRFFHGNVINIALIICLIKLCLLLSGDIEQNPGPMQGNTTRTLQSSISICHLNIRSLRNKIDDIVKKKKI